MNNNMIYTKVPGGLAVTVLRIQGCLARVAVLSQWTGQLTAETRWVRRSSLRSKS